MTSSEKKMLTLKSSDGEMFEIEQVAALISQTIKHMVENDCANNVIPLPNVTGNILAKVIEYCKQHAKTDKTEEDHKAFDDDFVKVDTNVLLDYIMAADHLNIPGLKDLTCQTVADMIMGKSPEDIRKTFNIKNSFTPEEEEELRRERQWAFE